MVATRTSASESFARSLFTRGTDFFGPAEIRDVLMIDLGDSIPEIPFTEEELTRARQLGQYLVLTCPINAKGKPLTMSGLYDALGNEIGGGKLLYEIDWYKDEDFFTTEPVTLIPTWKLVSREVIPGSTDVNYLGQTLAIAQYLREQVYEGQELPAPYQQAVDELESKKDGLERLMNDDWKKAAQQLADLQINQLFRENPAEVMYRLALYLKVNREYLLENMWTWTNSRSSDGYLVDVGLFDSSGAGVDSVFPRDSLSHLGVCFSRSSVLAS
jgi:hypothetical protein